jgi:hypothetical protein
MEAVSNAGRRAEGEIESGGRQVVVSVDRRIMRDGNALLRLDGGEIRVGTGDGEAGEGREA